MHEFHGDLLIGGGRIKQKSGMTDDQVYAGVEKAIRKYFGKRGDRVVQDNMTCIKRGYKETQEVPQSLIQAAAN